MSSLQSSTKSPYSCTSRKSPSFDAFRFLPLTKRSVPCAIISKETQQIGDEAESQTSPGSKPETEEEKTGCVERTLDTGVCCTKSVGRAQRSGPVVLLWPEDNSGGISGVAGGGGARERKPSDRHEKKKKKKNPYRNRERGSAWTERTGGEWLKETFQHIAIWKRVVPIYSVESGTRPTK
ncbi:hypothetical protein NDU88_006059 [Pleurodeles waltl]|uniref:Uncharacterized protein n=1 Tax=Pleurodeles waltl TaxID=8319 RepID=A0AAV7LPN9_PLEWA|nr:hypothetical protein NDU88_006059 [Pleurodeles waltl]